MYHSPPRDTVGPPNLDRGDMRVPKRIMRDLTQTGGVGIFLAPPNRQDNTPLLTCQGKYGGISYY